eukprot:gi/632939420/ref/XP_007909979.1/ PREDICTED: cadherin-like protein 26 isoform X2 [Callorhinchus milii]
MGMGIILFFLMTGTTVICSIHNEKDIQPVQDPIPQNAEEPKPIRLVRKKRMWILVPFSIVEEEECDYPKFAVKINHQDTKDQIIKFKISGPGVDMPPEMGLFKLEKDNDLVITRKVDREKVKEFKVKVDAMNNGNIVSKSMTFHVKVKDINDNKPTFNQSFYTVNVPENTLVGKKFFKVNVTDADEENNPNSQVSYRLDPHAQSSEYFSLDEFGSMSLKRCLDYEKVKSYTIIVHANDHGSPKLSSSATVNIIVKAANKHLPVFTETSFTAKVSENDTNVVIRRLSVTDADLPHTPAWRAKYSIVEGNEGGYYKIETDAKSNDGILTLIKHLDFEAGHQNQLKITVENEEPFRTCLPTSRRGDEFARVAVIVNDMNDAPVVNPPEIRIVKMEGLSPGNELVTFTATDPDTLFKNKIRFVIAYDPDGWVTVDEETGIVTNVQKLDRESPYVKDDIYKVIVHAVDDAAPPLTGTGILNILLRDVNDHKPYLISSYKEMCDEGDMRQVILTAADNDMPPYSSPFTFELLDDEHNAKEKWKLGKTTDNTVEFMRMSEVPIGNYTIFLNVRDQQGLSKRNFLNLRVCHCDDKNACPDAMQPTARLASHAIIVLFVGFLLLLISLLCLLIFMNKEHFKPQKSYQEPKGSLKEYNEEGGIPVDNELLPGVWREEIYPGFCPAKNQTKFDSEYHNRKQLETFFQQNIELHNNMDGVNYKPHSYLCEVEDRTVLHLNCLNEAESVVESNYLDNTGSSFAPLANVSQQYIKC